MPKTRQPIATRLRNRGKNEVATTSNLVEKIATKKEHPANQLTSVGGSSNCSIGIMPFSPRTDPDIYMDELQSELSFVRGSPEERARFLKEENDLMTQSFGKNFKATLRTSTFYSMAVSGPVPSKRTRHLKPLPLTIKTPYTIPATIKMQQHQNNKRKLAQSSKNNFSYKDSPSPTPSSAQSVFSTSDYSSESLSPPYQPKLLPYSAVPSPCTSPKKTKKSKSPISISSKKRKTPDSFIPPTPKSAAFAISKSKPNNSKPIKKSSKPKALDIKKINDASQRILETRHLSGLQSPSTALLFTANKNHNKKITLTNSIGVATPITANSGGNINIPLSPQLPPSVNMDAKEKEKEYWRRQRRVFVHSRFLTNDEGAQVARSVYNHLPASPLNRMVTTFQGNIANFRTKLRKIFDAKEQQYGITKDNILYNEDKLVEHLTELMSKEELDSIWEHWISEPFVDTKLFYADRDQVELLGKVTVRAIIIHFKEHYRILSPKQGRVQMRDLDLLSRTIVLPETIPEQPEIN